MTRMGLQTGFGEVRGAATMAALATVGCQVCRVSLNVGPDYTPVTPAVAEQILGEVLDAGMAPLVIIRDPAQIDLVPDGVAIELGNEPDLAHFGWTLESYRAALGPAIRRCDGRHPLCVGAVSNLLVTAPWEAPRGLTWLAYLPWTEIPAWVTCSHHWYPDDDAPHRSHIRRTALSLAQPRRADLVQLRDLVGDRPLAMTEQGYWTPAHGTPEDVAGHYAVERVFWMVHDYTLAIAYQLDDAPPPPADAPLEPQHGYGFRMLGSVDDWKPAAAAWFGHKDPE